MTPEEEQQIKHTLELQGLQQVQAMYKDAGIDGTSVTAVTTALSKGTITENTLTTILQSGMTEFEQQLGRKMTYGEMRELYG